MSKNMNTATSHTTTLQTPANNLDLQTYFEPSTLNQLGLIGSSLVANVRYHNTQIDKRGIQGIIGNLKIIGKPQWSLDLDLSCLLFDKHLNHLDTIYYGNLRNDNESIRHQGDSLFGARHFEETLTSQEEIHLSLDNIQSQVHHIAFVIDNPQNLPLHLTNKGVASFMDNEQNIAHKFDFSSLDKNCQSLLAWHLVRQDNDWLVCVPMQPLKNERTPHDFGEQVQTCLTQQSQRW